MYLLSFSPLPPQAVQYGGYFAEVRSSFPRPSHLGQGIICLLKPVQSELDSGGLPQVTRHSSFTYRRTVLYNSWWFIANRIFWLGEKNSIPSFWRLLCADSVNLLPNRITLSMSGFASNCSVASTVSTPTPLPLCSVWVIIRIITVSSESGGTASISMVDGFCDTSSTL